MPQTNLGRVAFKFQGDYSALTTYAKYDVVFDGESSYVSLIDANTGNLLTDATKWECLAKGGVSTPKYGTTDNRPPTTSIGDQYFDTTISKPIWYNGTNWVDSNGTNA